MSERTFSRDGTWVRVGNLAVDSGTIMVVDPCYVLRDKRDEDKGTDNGLEYSDALGFDRPEDDPQNYRSRYKALKEGDFQKAFGLGTKDGIMDYGFFFSSGYGDGSYPIWAKIYDEGEWGTRIGGLYVDFGLGPEKYDEDDDPDYFDDEDEVDELEGQ